MLHHLPSKHNTVLLLGLACMLGRGGTLYPDEHLSIVTDSLPSAIQGHVYSTTLEATGGSPPYRWSFPGYVILNTPDGDHRIDDVVSIAAGMSRRMVLTLDGKVSSWKTPSRGYEWVTDAQPDSLQDVKHIAAGYTHSLALHEDGTVMAWGDNSYGQCDVPEGLTDVVKLTAGFIFSLALKENGELVFWGNDWGDTAPPDLTGEVISIASGHGHTLALMRDGTVRGWGMTHTPQLTPPPGLRDVVGIAAGEAQGLALRSNGTVVAWGDPNHMEFPLVPQTGVYTISAGANYNSVLQHNGTGQINGRGTGYLNPPQLPSTAMDDLSCGRHILFSIRSDTSSPNGLNLSMSGTLSGTPDFSVQTDVTVVVRDATGHTVWKTIPIDVLNPLNKPPELESIVPTSAHTIISRGGEQTFQVTATDEELDPIDYTWHLDGAPLQGATASVFTYTPTDEDVGWHLLRCEIVETNTGRTSAAQWKVLVEGDITPPTLELTGGNSLEFIAGSTLPDPLADDFEKNDNLSEPEILLGFDSVNRNRSGSYRGFYWAIDSAGNLSQPVNRFIRILDPYPVWKDNYQMPAGEEGLEDDPNQDGRINLVHFAIDSSPMNNGKISDKMRVRPLADGENNAFYLTLTFPVLKGAVYNPETQSLSIDQYQYHLIADDNLDGEDLEIEEREIGPDTENMPILTDYDNEEGPDYEYRSFRLNLPVDQIPQGFIGLRVSTEE